MFDTLKRTLVGKKGNPKSEKRRGEEEEEEEESCGVCWREEDGGGGRLVNLKCGGKGNKEHKVCVECGIRYIQEQVEEWGEAAFPCPISAKCDTQVHPDIVRYLLRGRHLDRYYTTPKRFQTRKQLFREWEYQNVRKALEGEEEAKWCPTPHCRNVLLCGVQRYRCPKMTCDKCQKSFCGLCTPPAPLHPGAPCTHAEDITKIYSGLVQRCPKCKLPHGKTPGCNNVQCTDRTCSTKFCFQCGERVSTIRHYSLRNTTKEDPCRLGPIDVYEGLWLFRIYQSIPWPCLLFLGPVLCALGCVVVPLVLAVYNPWYWMQRMWRRVFDKKRSGVLMVCRIGCIFLLTMFMMWTTFPLMICGMGAVCVAFVWWELAALPCWAYAPCIGSIPDLIDKMMSLMNNTPEQVGILQEMEEDEYLDAALQLAMEKAMEEPPKPKKKKRKGKEEV